MTEHGEVSAAQLRALAQRYQMVAAANDARASAAREDLMRNLYHGIAETYRKLAQDLVRAADVVARLDEKLRRHHGRLPRRAEE